ncbi:hypothetical protein [Lacrimispora sp. 210928-DFI.3.58]|uniref:hypothetical protein n=1 Tax=Lacrimispora sp. 210928-DFI.3.58 TaxID=2883214 RepID=UPI001D078587|nr:hypothetical protein [Lacrimispora sp. 210928-DFI.3.58]
MTRPLLYSLCGKMSSFFNEKFNENFRDFKGKWKPFRRREKQTGKIKSPIPQLPISAKSDL